MHRAGDLAKTCLPLAVNNHKPGCRLALGLSHHEKSNRRILSVTYSYAGHRKMTMREEYHYVTNITWRQPQKVDRLSAIIHTLILKTSLLYLNQSLKCYLGDLVRAEATRILSPRVKCKIKLMPTSSSFPARMVPCKHIESY